MTRLILVRHAEAEGNIKRLFHGHTDSDITENGEKQLKALAERFADISFDYIYSSDLKRTYKTAQAVNSHLKLPISKDEGLREIKGGRWENQPWDILAKEHKDDFYRWENEPGDFKMPDGESFNELSERICNTIYKVLGRHKDKTVCIVSHGAAIRTFMCHIKGCTLKELNKIEWYENTAVTIIDFDDDMKPTIVIEGDASHLDTEIQTIQKQDWYKDIRNKNSDKD